MHVHGQDVEVSESVRPRLNGDRIRRLKSRIAAFKRLLGRLLSASRFLHFHNVKRAFFVVLRVIELRDALLKSLELDLDSG